jgi:hypothetical protein
VFDYPIVTVSFLSLFVSLPEPPSLQVTSMPAPLLSSFSKALAKHSIYFDQFLLTFAISSTHSSFIEPSSIYCPNIVISVPLAITARVPLAFTIR